MIAAVLLALISTSAADDLVRPKRADPTPGECAQSYPRRVGSKPPAGLIDLETGLVRCGAVAEPTSSLAYLLATEKHRDGIERLWILDVRTLETERDWYQSRYKATTETPWYRTPAASRWAGRLETLAAVGIVGGIVASIYKASGP